MYVFDVHVHVNISFGRKNITNVEFPFLCLSYRIWHIDIFSFQINDFSETTVG